jgi:putative peptide-modifying radical SAM enzyme
MNFYLTLTTECNLQCRYCYGKSCEDFGNNFNNLAIDYSLPSSITYETASLLTFLRKDPHSTLIFYGGEPLMKLDKLEEIMDAIPDGNFVLQTNGILLDQLGPTYVNRFESIFVSLDGDETVTDYYRGNGTFRKVMNNLRKIREESYRGEIVARMTVAEATEIDKQALRLIETPLISSVHWQLDALFWQNDYPKRDFSKWVREEYNPGVRSLIEKWVEHMRTHGEVWSLYPFVGVTRSLLTDEATRLRCGAGWRVFNIQTNGYITPCPVMAGMEDYYVGNILTDNPGSLRTFRVNEPCVGCELLSQCGGRCLYANVTKLWGNKGFDEVCETVRNLVSELTGALPEIKKLLKIGTIALTDFHSHRYNGCEVIP